MITLITIRHQTVVDRGYHDSENVVVTFRSTTGKETKITPLFVGYGGQGEGFIYRAMLAIGDQHHVLRYINTRRHDPILMPEVRQLVGAFEALGWRAARRDEDQSGGFGIRIFSTEYSLSLGTGAQPRANVELPASFIDALTGESERRQRTSLAALEIESHQWQSCTVTQEVVWSVIDGVWRFGNEQIMCDFTGPEETKKSEVMYKLGPMVRRGDRYMAYLSKYDGFEHKILQNDYALKSVGGNRPTRDDPPTVHLELELRKLLAEMRARRWIVEERSEQNTANEHYVTHRVIVRLKRSGV